MIAYISGKYSGNIEENIENARKVAIELWEKGYSVLCPHLNTIHFELDCKCTYEDYIKGDLELLARCDAIVMLQGWNGSKGAVREKEFAQSLGMPIYYYPELPILRTKMTDMQEAHLARVISKFTRDVTAKYVDGQSRHGGNLFDKPNLPMLLEEVQDMVVYAYTLQDQVEKATGLIFEDKEALNILTTGNSAGRILKDEQSDKG
jgi:hypothetical protein